MGGGEQEARGGRLMCQPRLGLAEQAKGVSCLASPCGLLRGGCIPRLWKVWRRDESMETSL